MNRLAIMDAKVAVRRRVMVDDVPWRRAGAPLFNSLELVRWNIRG